MGTMRYNKGDKDGLILERLGQREKTKGTKRDRSWERFVIYRETKKGKTKD